MAEQDQDAAEEACPLSTTDDRFSEAHYFLHEMMAKYHEPDPFRWSLNAFLQALRSVTWVLQAEMSKVEGFGPWYEKERDTMRADALLRAFVEGRNVVVHRGGLLLRSTAKFGMFRDRKVKLVLMGEINPALPSAYVVREHAPKLRLVHKDHVWIGEEYGIQRRWVAEELGQGEVVTLSDTAWRRVGEVMVAAHELVGRKGAAPPEHLHKVDMCDLLTETDLDPELPKKWGWVD